MYNTYCYSAYFFLNKNVQRLTHYCYVLDSVLFLIIVLLKYVLHIIYQENTTPDFQYSHCMANQPPFHNVEIHLIVLRQQRQYPDIYHHGSLELVFVLHQQNGKQNLISVQIHVLVLLNIRL